MYKDLNTLTEKKNLLYLKHHSVSINPKLNRALPYNISLTTHSQNKGSHRYTHIVPGIHM